MHPERVIVGAIVERLTERLGPPPDVAVVLGSGLGVLTERARVTASARYEDLGLPGSTVPGHAGRIARGRLGGAEVALLSGRAHLYEGHPPCVVARGVRALHAWGVGRLVLTGAVGGIRPGLEPGSLVLVSDHINLQPGNPLAGPAYGERFPDLSRAYDPDMRRTLREVASRRDIPLAEGIYVATPGPAYETPAEIRFLRLIGADVVGMSTVPEVLAAAEVGLPTVAVSIVSNLAAGLADRPLLHEEITEIAAPAALKLADLLEEALGVWASPRPDQSNM